MRIVQAKSRQTELVPDESRDRPHAQDDGKQMLADASHAFRSGQFLNLPFRATMLSERNQPAGTRDCPLSKRPTSRFGCTPVYAAATRVSVR
jgi:hypothetical protein